MIVTRDEILDAIDWDWTDTISYEPCLCHAFGWAKDLVPYLITLGASSSNAYKWPCTERGRQQRLLFLAFMLAWYDDIAEGKG